MRLAGLRQEIADLNRMLSSTGLVKWTSGNVSGRDPDSGQIVIKPSGVAFDRLTAEMMVVLDADGKKIEGDLKPSVDSASHLFVYRHREDVGGIVHTHSKYATAFAVAGRDLPVSTTTHACLFGDAIPCTGLASIGEEEIGRQIVDNLGKGPAVLLRNHGVFAIGKNAHDAMKHAVYVEESAEASFLAYLLSGSIPSLDESFIEDCRAMYLSDYGQAR